MRLERKKQKLENKNQSEAGITLIALVITIIVLIILAMVTIAMLTGPNGLLNKATEAKIENAHGEVRERLELETNAYLAEKLEGTYARTLLDYLKDKGFVKEDGTTVDVAKLTDGTQTLTGKEKELGKDVYKIEEKEVSIGNITKLASTEVVKIAASGDSNIKEYSINYYDEDGSKKEIGLLVDNSKLGSMGTISSSEPKKTITFTIDGTSYQCEKGTTWEEWISSSENTIKCWCYHTYPNPSELTSPLFDESDQFKNLICSSDTDPSRVELYSGEGPNEGFNYGRVLCCKGDYGPIYASFQECSDEIMEIEYRFLSDMYGW